MAPTLGRASISAAFVVLLLAAAFLGPTSACVCAALSEAAAARRLRTAHYAVAFNLLGGLLPALVAGNMVRAIAPHHHNTTGFYFAVAAAGAVTLTLNFAIVAYYQRSFRDDRSINLRVFWEYTPTQALNILLAVSGASIYVEVGVGGIAFALTALFSFSYMAHLLARNRATARSSTSRSRGACSPA